MHRSTVHVSIADITAAGICLWKGFEFTHRDHGYPPFREEHGGYIELVEWIASFAPTVAEFLATEESEEHPGVFHYEITEGLGEWLFNHPAATVPQFREDLERRFDEWMADNMTDFEVEATFHDGCGNVEMLGDDDGANHWSVYERRPRKDDNWRPLARWLADFHTRADAEAFAQLKRDNHNKGA